MNKIEFFNNVMYRHDKENQKYNEKLADLILTSENDKFDVYYEIYERVNEKYDINPYTFTFNDEESKIEKFSFKMNNEEDFLELYDLLNKDGKNIKTCYSSSECSFKKNSKKLIIFIQVDDVKRNFNIKSKMFNEKGERLNVI